MKFPAISHARAKITQLPDFRIDFAASAAFIALPTLSPIPIMPADLPESPVPLAEISQGPNAFEEFLDRNQKNLVILTILLALGAAAFVIYRGIETSRQETAGAALNKATDLAALQAVVSEHPDTAAAGSATVLLADRQWSEGQQDAAIQTLQSFISSSADHPALPSARASLGAKLMTQGKAPEAEKVFQAILDDPQARFIAPFALISLGDVANASGDLDKAEAAYNRVKTEYPESSFVDTATKRIANLKAKPPVEIEPPPAPKEEATPAAAPNPSPIQITPAPAPANPAPESAPQAPESTNNP